MIDRCENTNNDHFLNYGGRGISVCSRWRHGENGKSGYECFVENMGLRPDPKLTLDRRDNNGNYEPGNCRWVTRTEQYRNRRPLRKHAALDNLIHKMSIWIQRLRAAETIDAVQAYLDQVSLELDRARPPSNRKAAS
jgi:hypothetical protein